jgi:integrase
VKLRLTERSVAALSSSHRGGTHVQDTELRGFGVLVRLDGVKTFFVRYGGRSGRRWLPIGKHGEFTVERAREVAADALARARLAALGQGEDPFLTRERVRKTPTWGDWTATYVKRVLVEKKTGWQDERYLGVSERSGRLFRELRHRWETRPLTAISSGELTEFRDSLVETPIQANRWVASVRSCLAAAVKAGVISASPARGVVLFPENPPRQRVLSENESKALVEAIEAESDEHARIALLLLLTTGARVSEVLAARWSDLLDLEGDRPTMTFLTPKAGKPQSVPLPQVAVKALRSTKKADLFIVAGRQDGKPRRDLKGPWMRVLKAAGLESAGITVHDLRRTFGATVYAQDGLLAAQRLLRHADPRTTANVYAPQSSEDLRKAMERRAKVLVFPPREAAGTKS